MILAEELGVDWTSVRVAQGDGNRAYGDDQVTGGSASISTSYMRLRQAGAVGRTLLVNAACLTWGVNASACRVEGGNVIHPDGTTQLAFGELVATAMTLQIPEVSDVVLKDPSEFTIIGTRVRRVDALDMVTGKAIYGMDVRLPEMRYAALARPPVMGATIASYDSADAEAIGGVRQIVEVRHGLAVIADNSWAALQGRDALGVEWDMGENSELNTDSLRQRLADIAQESLAQQDAPAGSIYEATYELPFVAHTTMEPMNCTAHVRDDTTEVWAPTQNPQGISGTVHVPLIGCGLGRRLGTDYGEEAIAISREIGQPVKIVWSRDDDVRHDLFRPMSHHILRADLDENSLPTEWLHIVAGQDNGIAAGAGTHPYSIRERRVVRSATLPVSFGYWRAVWNNQMALARECFVDELAVQAGQDPYEFRRAMMANEGLLALLEAAAANIGWGNPLPERAGRGIAIHNSFGRMPAAVAIEVVVSEVGQVHVQRVAVAANCGTVINPLIVEQQIESGVIVAVIAAL
jgi:isoquinoline 1-oxidoreductase beta subunit